MTFLYDLEINVPSIQPVYIVFLLRKKIKKSK